MSEIQSAEALASDIRHQTRRWEYDEEQECDVGIDEPTLTLEESTELVRARDKATVKLTLDIVYKKYGLVVESDDVLRELGGEQ